MSALDFAHSMELSEFVGKLVMVVDKAGDLPTLRSMLKRLYQMKESLFNADKAYDSDKNCELVYAKKMTPNIKQQETLKASLKGYSER